MSTSGSQVEYIEYNNYTLFSLISKRKQKKIKLRKTKFELICFSTITFSTHPLDPFTYIRIFKGKCLSKRLPLLIGRCETFFDGVVRNVTFTKWNRVAYFLGIGYSHVVHGIVFPVKIITSMGEWKPFTKWRGSTSVQSIRVMKIRMTTVEIIVHESWGFSIMRWDMSIFPRRRWTSSYLSWENHHKFLPEIRVQSSSMLY